MKDTDKINFGGVCATRKQAYASVLKATNSEEQARQTAYGPQAVVIDAAECRKLISWAKAKKDGLV